MRSELEIRSALHQAIKGRLVCEAENVLTDAITELLTLRRRLDRDRIGSIIRREQQNPYHLPSSHEVNEERIMLLATKWNRPLTCKEEMRLSELTRIIRDRYPRVTQEDFDKIIQMAQELEKLEAAAESSNEGER